jgi:hypothetical protein
MEWGAVNATVTYLDNSPEPYSMTDEVNGWWIAADITAFKGLPQMGSATYSGKAVGYIAENGIPTYYTGRGDLDMN